MAIALNDVLRFTSHFDHAGNEALMVSYWEVSDTTDIAPNAVVAEAFQSILMASNCVGGLISAAAKATRTVMDNLSTPLEFGDFVGDIAGSNGGAAIAPDFVAILLRQTRTTRATRNGYKRIPYTTEGIVDGNSLVISAPVRVAVEDFFGVEAHLTGTFSGESIDVTLVPIIVGRTLVGGVYEPDLTRINQVSGAAILRPTTQNSRKP